MKKKKPLWCVTAIWPLPPKPEGARDAKAPFAPSLRPISQPIYDSSSMKPGKVAVGSMFILPPRQEFEGGTKVYMSRATGYWSSTQSPDFAYKTKKAAEDAAFKLAAAKPYWIGRLTVEKM